MVFASPLPPSMPWTKTMGLSAHGLFGQGGASSVRAGGADGSAEPDGAPGPGSVGAAVLLSSEGTPVGELSSAPQATAKVPAHKATPRTPERIGLFPTAGSRSTRVGRC